MKKDIIVYLSLLILCVLGSLFYFNVPLVDSGAYLHSVYYLQGTDLNDFDEQRVLDSYALKRPVSSLLVLPLTSLFGVRLSFAVLNSILYFASTLLVMYFVTRLFGKRIYGYIAAVLYATSLPLVLYGSMVLSDTTGFFFLILGIILIDRWIEAEDLWHHTLINLFIGIAILSREYCLILYPYYALNYFFKSVKTKSWNVFWEDVCIILKRIPLFGTILFSALPSILYVKLSNAGYFFEGKGSALTSGKLSLLGILRILGVTFSTLHLSLITTIYGVWKDQDKRRKFFYGTFFISCLPLILAGHFLAFLSPRMVFVLFPLIVSSSAFALIHFGECIQKRFGIKTNYVVVLCLMSYALVSYLGAWFYPAHFELPEDSGFDLIVTKTLESIMMKIGGLL